MASLLKLYLRELPEPLVPFVSYGHFQSAMKSKCTSSCPQWGCLSCLPTELAVGIEAVVDELQRALLQLPQINVNVMKYLV